MSDVLQWVFLFQMSLVIWHLKGIKEELQESNDKKYHGLSDD